MEIFRSVFFYISFTMVIKTGTVHGDDCKLVNGLVHCSKVKIIDLSVQCNQLANPSVSKFLLSQSEFISLPQNTTGNAKFQEIELYCNLELTDIHPLAFPKNAIKFTISYSPKLNKNVFPVIKEMIEIRELKLSNLGLQEVPQDAFVKNTNLNSINLVGNKIKNFKAILANRKLDILTLSRNNLTNDSFSEDVFKNITTLRNLLLQSNPGMTHLKEKVFKGLLDNRTVVQVGWHIGSENAPYMICAEQSWLCEENGGSYTYEKLVRGFVCVENKKQTIFDYCKSEKEKFVNSALGTLNHA